MAKRKSKWVKCEGSGYIQMLAWDPFVPTNYPGAVVCYFCSFGILVRKGTVHMSESVAGVKGLAGTTRVHYINKDTDTYLYKKPTVKKVV